VEPQNQASDQPGTLLDGRYELVEQLGQGGMAIVWRALMHGVTGFRRTVAIKRIDPKHRGYPEVVEMFVEEARVGAVLKHPNIVQAQDFRIDQHGNHFLVTEFVDGPHLGQWVDAHIHSTRPTPWPIVSAVAVEVLRALDAAHTRTDDQGKACPILHRDVTPGNILIDRNGVIKLADFGLARAMDRNQITRPNVVKGKLSYLAPELVQGNAPSPQSDLFSLGVVLWETLTKKRLFHANTDVEVYQMLTNPRVPLLSMQRSELPMGLTTCVHRALERDPGKRFASARQMLKTLTEVLRVWPTSTDAAAIAESVREAFPTANWQKQGK
jgi:serine/threonine-protein kinase